MEEKNYTAQESLLQITEGFRKMRIALARRKTGNYLILWGIIVSLGSIATEIMDKIGKYEIISPLWGILITIGIAGTVLMTIKRIKGTKGYFPEGAYIGMIWLSLFIYSLIIFAVLRMDGFSLSGIQTSLLCLNFAMLGYVLMGIFLGKELGIIGVAVSLASLLCGLYLKEIFNLVMAFLCLVIFVGGGIYINRKWNIRNEVKS